jgi:hypothetical protein
MNPFTKSLAGYALPDSLRTFIVTWDALESLVVRVFRSKAATFADEAEYATLRQWLQTHYADWKVALHPHWQGVMRAGKPCADDPFEFLIQPQAAHNFVGSRTHMQTLPAAREALNKLILSRDA